MFDEEQEPPELVSDATAALGAATRLGAGRRMKHINTQYFYIQKEVNEGRLKLKSAEAGTIRRMPERSR